MQSSCAKNQPGRCSTNAIPAGTQHLVSQGSRLRLWQVHRSTAISALRRRKTVTTHVWPREVGAQGTNKCKGISTAQVSQTVYTKVCKAGSGEASCHPGVPGEDLCPGPRCAEEGDKGATPGINTFAPNIKEQEQERRENKGSRLWRRPNELIAVSTSGAWDHPLWLWSETKFKSEAAAEGTAPS